MAEAHPFSLGALVFDGFETLDLFGPVEMFGTLEDQFAIELVGPTRDPVKTRHGQTVVPDRAATDQTLFDLILVPGGPGTPIEDPDIRIDDWLHRHAQAGKRILSVCTGSGLLARNGLLDRHRATTNKMAFNWVRGFGPNVDWVEKARWVEDGQFFTSSGVSAGMDMALAVIETLTDRISAEHVAEVTEYTWHQDASFDPFVASIR